MSLLMLTFAGLGVGLLAIALLVLSNQPSAGPLATPVASYPAQNPDLSLGSMNAPVILQEWADYQCPACKAYTLTLEPRLLDTYVTTGKVRAVFHDFAFIGARRVDQSRPDESVLAATGARCAGEQGKYWSYHAYLYANQGAENSGTFVTARLDDIARAVGLDMGAFDACLSGPTERSKVLSDTSSAQQAGVSVTPSWWPAEADARRSSARS